MEGILQAKGKREAGLGKIRPANRPQIDFAFRQML